MWVSPFRLRPANNKVILVRFEASILFAAYSQWQRCWFLCANGGEEKISDPDLWWCTDPNVTPEPEQATRKEYVSLRRSKRPQQLELQM
jgi:hypothetical protein